MHCLLLPMLVAFFVPMGLAAQTPDTTLKASDLNTKTLEKLNTSYSRLNTSVNSQSQQLLASLQKQEGSIKGLLSGRDTTGAGKVLTNGTAEYQRLMQKLQTPVANPVPSLTHYVPGIDSMRTAIAFLSKSGLPVDKLQRLQALDQQLKQLQVNFQNADDIQNYVGARQAQLQSVLSQYNMQGRLSSMSKQAFYYQQQVAGYKDVLNNQDKQQQLVLAAVRQVPAFQSFWQKNSMLSQLFPVPGNTGTLLAGTGLQTGAQVGKLIQQRLGVSVDDGGKNAAQYLQQQAGNAQGQMDQLKQKLDNLNITGGGSSNMVLPDFTPNPEKKKTFFNRLQLGFDQQTTGKTAYLPVISTLGLSLGYMLSGKATVGVGASYLLGLGTGLNQISLSSQGAGLRSFIDIKAFKSLWITGGYEYTYVYPFSSLKDIRNLSAWQKSALIGLMEKYSIGKRSGNVQILYDALAQSAIPSRQAFQVRFGFSL